ncbi:hypothetical protein FHU23_004167 [Clostridium saccharobutylicum]|uniref:Uncharacterized protein n=1 Tax=Clostridium saccharobutylicum DSM 13864 TaxID=1345695 RepID=U5MYE4_CLOSA|nr:hypothetical protein CLSA_c35210 [Clostridium saccharobutylicum DSM 13864]MBA2907438.1 hypothetical protein [Clostridium saccharobutylicum]MBA8791976.1 hypothetical protein [Clostridium saccharobutylicum]MBA8898716.1 hypothetical protein [Clostridium saccharobutylicum]MBA8983870.1 hypothetical protein [Clostridium saccharobutylicum]
MFSKKKIAQRSQEYYSPELPSSNRSHQGEDMTEQYFGP